MNTLLPGLEKRVVAAQADVKKVRGNAALRDELYQWFEAWMEGLHMLPTARQREFLFAVQARVTLWRPSDRSPRADLLIGLPTDVMALPPAPEVTVASDGWHIPLDLVQGEKFAENARDPFDLLFVGETPEELEAQRQAWAQAGPEVVLAAVADELLERGATLPESIKSLTT